MPSKPDLRVDWATHESATFACKTWHYSGCMPAGKLVKVGVWEDGAFIGVVLFGRGANMNIGKKYGLTQLAACELVRIALRAHGNPVSRIVAVALRFLKAQSPGLRLIISYADPEQGHHGGIYQAGNWIYSGPSQPQREVLINGRDVHKRSAHSKYGTASPAKIAAMTGHLVTHGPERWKYTYLMPLDAAMRTQLQGIGKPYPRAKQATAGDQPDGGGATPTRTLQPSQGPEPAPDGEGVS